MPKQTNEAPDREVIACVNCHGARFQVHERGELVRQDGAISVEVNELAIQCLDCHRVEIVPVKGTVDYYA